MGRIIDQEDYQQTDHLQGHFLISMPTLRDSYFSQSVSLICEYNEEGAMGLVISQPSNSTLGEIFEQLCITDRARIGKTPLMVGGPVEQGRGFILHSPEKRWESTILVTDKIALTGSIDILHAMAEGHGPERFLVALGYAGWSAGQLEEEIAENSWLTTSASDQIVFETPAEQRWNSAASSLGVDLNLISSSAGHA